MLAGIALQFALPCTTYAAGKNGYASKSITRATGRTPAIKDQIFGELRKLKAFRHISFGKTKLSINTRRTSIHQTYRDRENRLMWGKVRPVKWQLLDRESGDALGSGHARAMVPTHENGSQHLVERPGSKTQVFDITPVRGQLLRK